MKYYAGIGSRNTPVRILKAMEQVAKFLSKKGYILRSDSADGSDKVFEKGCIGKKEIYLPWNNFNNNKSNLIVRNKRAFEIAEKYHPYFSRLSSGARLLQARNSYQVLGKDLNTPSNFILCYTKGGKGSGGTGQAIRIAKAWTFYFI